MFPQPSKALVALFLHIAPCFTVPLSDFYPYGVSEGDRALPANDDGSSGEISISIPFPYFDRNHDSLFVNTNGVISFLEEVSQFTPAPFPLGDERRLISPFWGDVDTRNGGTVSYRESTDPVLLQQATNDVHLAFLAHQKFSATWIFIATWDRVAFYGASESAQSKVNTFQAVLVTDGRYSFAIFNYNVIVWTTGRASQGDADTGLGGTPAQGGFNAGDGIRFFVIPGSRTNDILNLPSTSNVARAGQWMFRTDEASVEAGGCDSRDSGSKTLILSPYSGIMLGGTNVKMSGPCFTADDNIVVQIDNEININATFGSELHSSVTVPVLNKTGRLPIKLSIDGGNSFDYSGLYTSVPINRYTPAVQRTDGDSWEEDSSVDISWNPESIGGLDDEVSIDLARYKINQDDVPALDSFHTAVDSQLNNGHSQFVITTGQGDGNIEDRFINLVRVSRKSGGSNVSQSQWVWSDVFAWKNIPWANDRCSKWHLKEPSPDKFTGDSSLQPCPRILTQAMADRGRFMSEEECNPSNRDGCARYHEGAVHCFKMVIPSSMGAGQQCCYNNFGNLMMGKHAGSLDRVHPNAGIPVISHFFHDIVPYQDCCRLTNNCEKYFEKRPSDDGSQYQAPRPATGFGDPHMVTLDGTPFTFNGYGEYFILKVSGVDFALQGRMEPLVGDDGSLSRATVYTAFAAKEQGSDTVQIQLNGRGLVDVLVNGEAAIFDELSLLEFNGVSVLQYVNTSKFSAIFNSGISVTVEGQQELLGLVTLVPTMFKGNTTGLLGFWDDSQESEFFRPDGTFLRTNVSLEVIHRDFGQLWVTRPDESLFVYQQGQSHSTFHHPSYQPIFPDSQSLEFTDKALEKEAQDICGDNSECLFDIFTTGKVRIGRATKETVKQFVAVINDTVKPACVPLDSQLADGVVHRNDTEGGIDYKFECNRGFVMNGSNHVKCEDGVYNGSAPNCLPKECPLPAPGNLNNGVVYGDGSVYRSTYYFTCYDGYALRGHAIVSCTENGSWNGTTPSCLKECPVLPSSISNGDVHGSGSVQGSRWRFSCHRGYGLVGRDVLQCTEQGIWNASVPTCLIECPLLPSSIANGFVNGRGSVEGSQYQFSCKQGYSLAGTNTLYCNDQGNWNGSVPSCIIEPNGDVTARVERITATEIPCEQNALGAAEGGKLSSVDFTASSNFPDFAPSNGRLNGPLAWCSLGNTAADEYLQIHVPEAESICVIATQGTGYIWGNEYVIEYHVKHSEDGRVWKGIEEEPGETKVFKGNRDSKSVSKQVLPAPVKATYVRIFPLQYDGWICMRVELYGREKNPRAPFPAVADAESSTVTPPLPTTAVKRKGMDIGILIDSSSGVTADEFKRLKSFILQLVNSINKNFSNVHFGIIVYSDKPDLVMSLQNVDRIKIESIIQDVKYNPGGHRTDLAMLYASQKLFCPEGCKDHPEVENVLIVFTSEKTDAESLPYSFVAPIMKNCTWNIIAVGISHDVSKAELIKIAVGTPDGALKVKSPDHLNSGVISKIEGILNNLYPWTVPGS